MRCMVLLLGLILMSDVGVTEAAEIRVLSVGSVQVATKALAAEFNRKTGHTVTLTVITPNQIPRKLASEPFDMLIASAPAMEAHDKAGIIRAGSRAPLARVGIGVIVRDGAAVPDISTPEGFRRTLLAAHSIVHGNPAVPNQSGVVTMRILEKAGILEVVKAKARTADLADGFAMVARGEVELALFNTVELPAGVRLAGPVPPPLADHTYFETAVLAKGTAPDGAQAFITAMTSSSARKTWEDAMLDPYPYR